MTDLDYTDIPTGELEQMLRNANYAAGTAVESILDAKAENDYDLEIQAMRHHDQATAAARAIQAELDAR